MLRSCKREASAVWMIGRIFSNLEGCEPCLPKGCKYVLAVEPCGRGLVPSPKSAVRRVIIGQHVHLDVGISGVDSSCSGWAGTIILIVVVGPDETLFGNPSDLAYDTYRVGHMI